MGTANSCIITKVGLGMDLVIPNDFPSAFVKVVLPLPSSPIKAMISPPLICLAIFLAWFSAWERGILTWEGMVGIRVFLISTYIVAVLTLLVKLVIVIGYMENIQTILKNIAEAKRVAIALPSQLTVDMLCAAVALQTVISTRSENPASAAIFSASAEVPALPFLKNTAQIHRELSGRTELTIKVSTRNAQPGELRYEKGDDGLLIFIKPSSGQFLEHDVSVLPAAGNFDLVIILGAANFEQLGTVYRGNTKLFFETPNINIDINPDNEYYGTVNFVSITSSSLSETVFDIIEKLPNALDNETVSTSLLAGIISQTSSFRDPKTTPMALQKASRLVASGAKQQDIIQHLFKTKPLPLLQLWGRALARITAQPDKKALTAIVTASDLEKTKVQPESLPIILRDIIEMVTGYSLFALLAEMPSGATQILLAGLPYENISQTVKQFFPDAKLSLGDAKLLTGKYEYLQFTEPDTLAKIQERLAQLIEKRGSVV